ncbi:MAG: GNAT family N-acetyltransferase [Bacteroidota bacterium]|nr:GNAT family N-acetyltransferase [Bacteroidota bacterium]
MIHYLPHKQINKSLWDECVRESVNGIIYGFSWYLDIVSPGWDGLIEDNYTSVFPLTHRKKSWISYLYQPFFTQQLGLFSRSHLTPLKVEEFLKNIPTKFRFVEIHLNSMNKASERESEGKFTLLERKNFEMDLIPSYDILSKQYSKNTRRNIKKALNNPIEFSRKTEPDELITLFKENFGNHEGKLKYRDYDTLRNLMTYCIKEKAGWIVGAYLPGNLLCAGVFFLQVHSRIIYHFAATSAEGKECGAMSLLIDKKIRENAGKPVTFDFEGSNDPNVARFYKGFGASEVPYYMVRINRLPDVINKAIKLIHKGNS